jgi:hypothetical protein
MKSRSEGSSRARSKKFTEQTCTIFLEQHVAVFLSVATLIPATADPFCAAKVVESSSKVGTMSPSDTYSVLGADRPTSYLPDCVDLNNVIHVSLNPYLGYFGDVSTTEELLDRKVAAPV